MQMTFFLISTFDILWCNKLLLLIANNTFIERLVNLLKPDTFDILL